MTVSISSSAGRARIIRLYASARTARASTAGASTPMSSIWCGRWPGRCRTWGLRLLSIGLARRRPRGIRGPERGWPPCARITTSPSIERANVPSEARSTLDEAAEALSVSPATVRRLIVEGALACEPILQRRRRGPFEPPIFGRAEVAREAERRRKRSRIGPPSEDEPALALNFQ